MRKQSKFYSPMMKALKVPAVTTILLSLSVIPLSGQKVDMQQHLADLKESMAKNKQALAQYTWKEELRIFVKGDEKKTEHFHVRMGPDGKPQKTPMDSAPRSQAESSGPRGRLRQRIVERKKEEYEDYADRMKALVQQYVPPDKNVIQDAFSKGNMSFTPGAGGAGEVKIVIQNYLKPNDSMTIFFNKDRKQISSIRIASYMDDPTDGMNLNVQCSSLPDGPSHVSSTTIEGVRKQLTIKTQNSDYQKL